MTEAATFVVDEMTCSHCAGNIHRALKQHLPADATFTVDLEDQTVRVQGDPETAASIIRGAGYEPRRVGEVPRRPMLPM